MTREIIDNVVIGGGPAGSMAAMRLAAAGREVILLEKDRAAQAKVCGEFLSCEAVAYLRASGIEPLALGAVPIRMLRVTAKGRTGETALPFPALSLSRRVLDEAMIDRARELGCDVRRGVRVEKVAGDGSNWRVEAILPRQSLDAAPMGIRARTVFLASGKHDLRGWGRNHTKWPCWIGLKMHWHLAPDATRILCNAMELFLFRGGYAGLSLIEQGTANLCIAVQRQRFQAPGSWENLIDAIGRENPRLKTMLRDAKPECSRPLAVSPIPYGYLAKESRGLWRVGDQAAVVPSFTGDGMAIAMHSALLAAEMALAGSTAGEYERWLCADLGRGVGRAGWLSRAMNGPAGRSIAALGLQLFPGAMRGIANATRIPESALLRHFQR